MAPNFSTCQIFFPDVRYSVNGINLCNSMKLFEIDNDNFENIYMSHEGVLNTFGGADSCAVLSCNLAEEMKSWSFRFISTLFVPLNRNVSVHNFGRCTDNIWDYFPSEECWKNFEERLRFVSLCKALDISGLESFENHGPKCVPYFQWTSSKNNKKLQCGFKKFMEKTNENIQTPFDVLILEYNQDSWPFGSECDKWIKRKKFRLGVFLIPTCNNEEKKVQIYDFRKIIFLKQNRNNDIINTTSLRFLNERCNKGHVILT